MDKLVHFEIPVPAGKIDDARAFYSIFGWDMQDWPMPDGSRYVGVRTVPVNEETRMPTEPGAINGGIVEANEYVKMPVLAVHVESIDERIKQIEAVGGKVVKPKIDMMGMGFYAYVADPFGTVLGLWEDAKKS